MNIKSCKGCGIVIDEERMYLLPDKSCKSDKGMLNIHTKKYYKYWECPMCNIKNISSVEYDNNN